MMIPKIIMIYKIMMKSSLIRKVITKIALVSYTQLLVKNNSLIRINKYKCMKGSELILNQTSYAKNNLYLNDVY